MLKKMIKKGFTLIELIVVIVIIGIVTAIVIPAVMTYIKYGNDNTALTIAEAISKDLNDWYSNYKTEGKDLEKGTNLLYDFVDYELDKNPDYSGKLTYGYVPAGALMSADEQEPSKYYKKGTKDKFDNTSNSLIIYNNGKLCCAIVIPLNTTNYYFTGDSRVYKDTYSDESKLLTKYCNLADGLDNENVIDLINRKVTVSFIDVDENGVSHTIRKTEISSGESVTPPSIDEVKEFIDMSQHFGYEIAGWENANNANETNFNQITHSTTFKVKYTPIEYTVNYYIYYEDEINNQEYYNESLYEASGVKNFDPIASSTVKYGNNITLNPYDIEGYTFNGFKIKNKTGDAWIKIANNQAISNQPLNLETFPLLEPQLDKEDHVIDIYADWSINTYNVTLHDYDTNVVNTFPVKYNTTLQENINFNNYDYLSVDNFLTTGYDAVKIKDTIAAESWGWYLGNGVDGDISSAKYDFTKNIRRDIDLYAIPNYNFYVATSTNNWLGSDNYIYFKVNKSTVIKGNEGMAIYFIHNSDSSKNYWSELEYSGEDETYKTYYIERKSDYKKFQVCRVDGSTYLYSDNAVWNASVELTYSSTSQNTFYIDGIDSTKDSNGRYNLKVRDLSGTSKTPKDTKYFLVDTTSVSNSTSYYWYAYIWNGLNQKALVKLPKYAPDYNSNIYICSIPTDVIYTNFIIVSSTDANATVDTVFNNKKGQSADLSCDSYTRKVVVLDKNYKVTKKQISGSDYRFTSAGGTTSLIPTYGSAYVDTATSTKYVYGLLVVTTSDITNSGGLELKVVQKYNDDQFWFGYETLDDSTRKLGYVKSQDDLYGGKNIKITSAGTYRVAICFSDSKYKVPTVKITTTDEIEIRYNYQTTQIHKEGPIAKGTAPTWLNENGYTKEGYTFEGWYREIECINKVNPGDTFTQSTTLYAKMTPNTYSITKENFLIANCEPTFREGQEIPDTYLYGGDAINLSYPYDASGHYTFEGWYLDSEYTNRVTVLSSTPAIGEGYKIYAHWIPATYEVKYSMNGGVNSSDNPRTITYNPTGSITLKDPTRNQYEFGGWYDNSDFTGEPITSLSTNINKTVRLYAKWVLSGPSSIELNSSTGEYVNITNVDEGTTIELDSSKVPSITATIHHDLVEAGDATAVIKWVTEDWNNDRVDANVLSDNENITITRNGTYTYYVLVRVRVPSTNDYSDYILCPVTFVVNNKSYESKEMQWTGSSLVDEMKLDSEYENSLIANGYTVTYLYYDTKDYDGNGAGPYVVLNGSQADAATEIGTYMFKVIVAKGSESIEQTAQLDITKRKITELSNGKVFTYEEGVERQIVIPGTETTDAFGSTDWINISSDSVIKATESGTYTYTAKIIDTDHLTWANESYNDSNAYTFSWKITGTVIYLADDEANVLYYNGNEQTFNYVDYIERSGATGLVELSGEAPVATEVGEYEFVLNLVDTENSTWADGTVEPATIKWVIEKGTPTVKVIDGVKQYPNASEISTLNQLQDSTLSGGTMVSNCGNEVKGTWAWKTPETIVYASDKTTHTAVFTPFDTDSYYVVDVQIRVPVKQLLLTTSNIISKPFATTTYLSSLDSIENVGINSQYAVVRYNDYEVKGEWSWATNENGNPKKYEPEDAINNKISAGIVFTPFDTSSFSKIEVTIDVNYTKNSQTLTLNTNSHIGYYTVKYWGNPDGNNDVEITKLVQSNSNIEVLTGRQVEILLDSNAFKEGYSFTRLLVRNDIDNNEISNKPATGSLKFNMPSNDAKLYVVTAVESKKVTINNVTGLQITATASIEQEDGTFMTNVPVANGQLVPGNSLINLKYTISSGYQLVSTTAIPSGMLDNLILTSIPSSEAITGEWLTSFVTPIGKDVVVSGEVDELEVTLNVEKLGAGSGKIFVYKDNILIRTVSELDDIFTDKIKPSENHTYKLIASADGGNALEAYSLNGVSTEGSHYTLPIVGTQIYTQVSYTANLTASNADNKGIITFNAVFKESSITASESAISDITTSNCNVTLKDENGTTINKTVEKFWFITTDSYYAVNQGTYYYLYISPSSNKKNVTITANPAGYLAFEKDIDRSTSSVIVYKFLMISADQDMTITVKCS